jgi:hypothetical protein
MIYIIIFIYISYDNINENSPSIAIENIAAPNNQYTNTQVQPLSVTPIYDSTRESQPFSDIFNIPSCLNDIVLPSTDINNIAVSHSHNGVIQNQNQSLSVPLAQQSVNGTLIHTSEQDTNNIDSSSDVSESHSIDINSINLNNHVSYDCESLPIEIKHISASHTHDGII